MERFRFANKPGTLPGKPISIGESASINDLKHVARIDARQRGLAVNCRRLNSTGARLIIGVCESGAAAQIGQGKRALSVRMGGAF